MRVAGRWAVVAAYAVAVLAAALAAGGVTLTALSPSGPDIAYLAVGVTLGAASVVLGVLVAHRRPANPVGPLLCLLGVLPCFATYADVYASVTARSPGLLPVWPWLVALSAGTWMLLYVPPALLMLYFPDGRLPSRRWRPAAAGLIVVPLLFIVVAAADPAPWPEPYDSVAHPFPAPAGAADVALTVAGAILLIGLLVLLVSAATAMVVRYRRADAEGRAQLKWFALGAACLPATLLLCWLSYLLLDGADLVVVGLAATFLAIPAATAIALLRHDLYDVDRALSATVTYGAATTLLLAFFTVASFLGGLAMGQDSAAPAAAATAVCAAALAPLRSGLRRRVDRRMYPARRAALDAIQELHRRTHAGLASPEQLGGMLRTALRDPALRVGYRAPGDDRYREADGTPLEPGAARQVPVLLGGEQIGVLVAGPRHSRSLLREVAAACVLQVEVVRLRAGLTAAVRDVESSRSRLLRAGYVERRRLERDLHDGAQQRLVSLGMGLRLAQRHLADGSVDVDGLLEESVGQLGAAVAELRQIAHGLRPSSLDDGLGPALVALAGSVPLPVVIEVAEVSVPDDVATTAYYVVSEAVTNAVKHARAATIGVRVAASGSTLTVRISDDGQGGAQPRPGTGLSGLTDRVAAAGGELRLESPPGRGTVVEAVLPCGS